MVRTAAGYVSVTFPLNSPETGRQEKALGRRRTLRDKRLAADDLLAELLFRT
jgi:hypothetical protein